MTSSAMTAALDQAVSEVQAERDRVAALLTERRELIASVSHEFARPFRRCAAIWNRP
ncbi:MAG: hypothetical protein U0559_08025 [Anaerolineae bacterium]